MRVRQEAKILKNDTRELKKNIHDNIIDPSYHSRYSDARIMLAYSRLIKACKRRYLNDARRAKRDGDITSYRLNIHNACSPYIVEDAYDWWNIGNI